MKKFILLCFILFFSAIIQLSTIENNNLASSNKNKNKIKTNISQEKLEHIFEIINREKIKSPDGSRIGPYRKMRIPRHMTMEIYEEETYYKIVEITKSATREYKIDKRTGRIFDIICKTKPPVTVYNGLLKLL